MLEVDLEYPEDLHDEHNNYPLAPEVLKINGVNKLIPNPVSYTHLTLPTIYSV